MADWLEQLTWSATYGNLGHLHIVTWAHSGGGANEVSADIDSIVNPVVVHDHSSECSKMLWNGLDPIRQREADTDEASMSLMLSPTVLDIAV